MARSFDITTTGLRDLRQDLKALDKAAPKEISAAMRPVAEIVATETRRRVVKRSGRAAASYKARGKQGGAAIAFGGTAAPYAPWLDWGGPVGIGGSVKREWLGRPTGEGRYLYPAITAKSPEVVEVAEKALIDLMRKHGLDK